MQRLVQRQRFLSFVLEFSGSCYGASASSQAEEAFIFLLNIPLCLTLLPALLIFLVCFPRAAVSHVRKSHGAASFLAVIHDIAVGSLFI